MTVDKENIVSEPNKVYVYIDGFNLYHGIKTCNNNKLKWLDLQKLIEFIVFSLLGGRNKYSIEQIKYFTAKSPEGMGIEKKKRQKSYLQAIQYKDNNALEIIYGRFIKNNKGKYEEKETDVNIACNILEDAHDDKYETALIVSGDGDIVPALKIIEDKYDKKVIVVYPPKRANDYMKEVAHENIYITKRHLQKCLFPETIETDEGEKIECPDEWKYQTENNEEVQLKS